MLMCISPTRVSCVWWKLKFVPLIWSIHKTINSINIDNNIFVYLSISLVQISLDDQLNVSCILVHSPYVLHTIAFYRIVRHNWSLCSSAYWSNDMIAEVQPFISFVLWNWYRYLTVWVGKNSINRNQWKQQRSNVTDDFILFFFHLI